ncbi:hypothetical protein DIPPA_23332 [Diplonema papillatum]|nr:hypothetical protein DIPPA_23332 [Diplonema papillatum]
MFVAKRRLADLRRQRRDRIENAAARRIQRFARHALQKMELRRLEEYYNAKRLTKLRAQRRFEGALTLQCAWRGSRARKLYAVVKEVHVEKTAAAATIRRNWASYLLRKTMDKLSVARRAKYGRRRDASLLIQKFWRAVLAREYLQMLREDREIAEDAAIHLQCWWRQAEARRAAQRKREARRRQQTAARLDAIQLDVFVLLLQSCARTTAAQVDRRDRTVLKLKADIESKRRYTLGVRHGASLRIQSCYRGYLGRMYAKGVRREKREVALRENALKALQCDAACTIQRCVRTRQSRRKAAGMRADKAAAAAQEKEVMEASQEASDVVVQLFWEMEAMQGMPFFLSF